jgi:hypothetical protein
LPPGCAVGVGRRNLSNHFSFLFLLQIPATIGRQHAVASQLPSASSWNDFPTGSEPNEVSMSKPGCSVRTLHGGISHSSDKRIKTEFSISFTLDSVPLSFVSALSKIFLKKIFFFVS